MGREAGDNNPDTDEDIAFDRLGEEVGECTIGEKINEAEVKCSDNDRKQRPLRRVPVRGDDYRDKQEVRSNIR